jgi:hypothetical protein
MGSTIAAVAAALAPAGAAAAAAAGPVAALSAALTITSSCSRAACSMQQLQLRMLTLHPLQVAAAGSRALQSSQRPPLQHLMV